MGVCALWVLFLLWIKKLYVYKCMLHTNTCTSIAYKYPVCKYFKCLYLYVDSLGWSHNFSAARSLKKKKNLDQVYVCMYWRYAHKRYDWTRVHACTRCPNRPTCYKRDTDCRFPDCCVILGLIKRYRAFYNKTAHMICVGFPWGMLL